MRPSGTTIVMAGRVEEFRLEDVLQVVGSSPQCTAIELFQDDGTVRGRIWIQSGRVLGAIRVAPGDERDDITMTRRLDDRTLTPDPRS